MLSNSRESFSICNCLLFYLSLKTNFGKLNITFTENCDSEALSKQSCSISFGEQL